MSPRAQLVKFRFAREADDFVRSGRQKLFSKRYERKGMTKLLNQPPSSAARANKSRAIEIDRVNVKMGGFFPGESCRPTVSAHTNRSSVFGFRLQPPVVVVGIGEGVSHHCGIDAVCPTASARARRPDNYK